MSSQRIRGSLLVVCLVGTVAASGCGDKKADQSPERENAPETADKGAAPAKSAEKVPEKTPAPVETKKPTRTLSAHAEIAEGPEGGAGKFSFSVGVAEDGSADGRATVNGEALRLSGMVKDGAVRLWAGGPETGTLRGGFLLGTESEGEASGTFVLSGNGGAPALHGTWKSQ